MCTEIQCGQFQRACFRNNIRFALNAIYFRVVLLRRWRLFRSQPQAHWRQPATEVGCTKEKNTKIITRSTVALEVGKKKQTQNYISKKHSFIRVLPALIQKVIAVKCWHETISLCSCDECFIMSYWFPLIHICFCQNISRRDSEIRLTNIGHNST